jgi:membrane-bound metal-dependent hydrolase YbcI (DUF457 family)
VVLWFAGGAAVITWQVFRSPGLDYRVVMAGAVLPVLDAVCGGVRPLHTLVAAVGALVGVMVATRRRRLVRRRWLGVPIGLFLHLVLDGVWSRTKLFWWPLFGTAGWRVRLPELSRGAVAAVLEVAGAALLVWFWRANGLSAPSARARFVRTGQVPRQPVR